MSRFVKLSIVSIALIGSVTTIMFLAGDWVSKKELTAMEMRIAKRAVERYANQQGHLPVTLQQALKPIGKSRIVDRWGDSFRYVVVDEDLALLISVRKTKEDPSDALVLECARHKTETEGVLPSSKTSSGRPKGENNR